MKWEKQIAAYTNTNLTYSVTSSFVSSNGSQTQSHVGRVNVSSFSLAKVVIKGFSHVLGKLGASLGSFASFATKTPQEDRG